MRKSTPPACETRSAGRARRGPAAFGVPSRLGARLRSIRNAKALTQEDVAARAKLKPETISRVETGAVTPDLATLGKLVSALGVSFGTVLDGDTDGDELVGHLAELREVLPKLGVPERDLVIRMARALATRH